MDNKRLTYFALIIAAITAVVTFFLTTAFNASVFALFGNSVTGKADEIAKLIYDNYYLSVQKENLREGAAMGTVAALGDPYSSYLNKEDFEKINAAIMGNYSGIGVSVTGDPSDLRIVVVQVFEGSPAEKAGIKGGDKIIRVGDMEVDALRMDDAVTAMKGKAGTEVTITVIDVETGEPVVKTLIRDTIIMKTTESRIIGDGVGYIKITSFDKDTAKEFDNHFAELGAKGATRLIIDLRGNPGGIVDAAADIADRFLGEGIIYYTENNKKERTTKNADKDKTDIPLVILVNEGSASASELFAGAIRDHGRGAVVGAPTFGKGLVQRLFKLNDGTYIKLTIEKYFTPSGDDINQKGITPDYLVNREQAIGVSVEQEQDAQLTEAIRILTEQP